MAMIGEDAPGASLKTLELIHLFANFRETLDNQL
jgi:hypothetical protein